MEYSDENLMRLIGQTSHHMTGHGRKKTQGNHNHDEGHVSDDRIGYPNCLGPGCGNGCSYKGTDECPKVAARNGRGNNTTCEEKNHFSQKDDMRQDKECHGHPDRNNKDKEHCRHSEEESQKRHGHWKHGEHDEHNKHDCNRHERKATHGPMGRERILTILSEEESISQCALAEKLGIRPQSVSELLGKLEADGYIIRTQNDQDKRETLVSLSTEGKKRANEVKSLQEKRTAEFLSPLNEEEKQTLFKLLIKLTGTSEEK